MSDSSKNPTIRHPFEGCACDGQWETTMAGEPMLSHSLFGSDAFTETGELVGAWSVQEETRPADRPTHFGPHLIEVQLPSSKRLAPIEALALAKMLRKLAKRVALATPTLEGN